MRNYGFPLYRPWYLSDLDKLLTQEKYYHFLDIPCLFFLKQTSLWMGRSKKVGRKWGARKRERDVCVCGGAASRLSTQLTSYSSTWFSFFFLLLLVDQNFPSVCACVCLGLISTRRAGPGRAGLCRVRFSILLCISQLPSPPEQRAARCSLLPWQYFTDA